MNKGYSLTFKDKSCVISNSSEDKVATMPMIHKSIIINWHSNISCKTIVDGLDYSIRDLLMQTSNL